MSLRLLRNRLTASALSMLLVGGLAAPSSAATTDPSPDPTSADVIDDTGFTAEDYRTLLPTDSWVDSGTPTVSTFRIGPQSGEGGGGGVPGGGGVNQPSGLGTTSIWYDYGADLAIQGTSWSSFEWFIDHIWSDKKGINRDAVGWNGVPSVYQSLTQACTNAFNDASSRGAQQPYRVVGMMWSYSAATVADGGWNSQTVGSQNPAYYRSELAAWQNAGYPGLDYSEAQGPGIRAKIIDRANYGINQGGNKVSSVCVVLGSDETVIQDYPLSVSTVADTNDFSVGGGGATRDLISTWAGGSSIRENITANVTLNWDGFPATGTVRKSATKSVTLSNNQGSQLGPRFSPVDLGMSSWAAGRYWYDVTVAKQGKMSNSVDTPDREGTETWSGTPKPPTKYIAIGGGQGIRTGQDSLANRTTNQDNVKVISGMPFTSQVSAQANGAISLSLYDTVMTDKVWLGGSTSDDTSKIFVVRGDDKGTEVPATITIHTDVAGQKTVRAIVANANGLADGWYTLVVPTTPWPTGSDYVIPDTSEACWNPTTSGWTASSQCVKGADRQGTKVSPKPNKVWVLDEQGALTAADPTHSNEIAADGRTFVPGDSISAVVNDTIAANLANPITPYILTDDWTDAVQYIDFSNVSLAKVWFNGVNVTNEFDIKIEGTKTIATAKPEFSARTKGLTSPAQVKLYISGTFRTDLADLSTDTKMLNKGSARWGNEVVKTNEPPVYVRTPKPDKVWVLDKEGALQFGDPSWTNNVGADTKVFEHDSVVGAVVNGKFPKNLATDLDYYHIIDDWSDAAQYIDFTSVDPSQVMVIVGGKDRTADFDISIQGSTTVAVAKRSALQGTANLPADVPVKLITMGKFKPLTEETDTQGEVIKLINKGSERWNNNEQPSNEPPVFIWNPDPDKDVIGSASNNGDQSSINGQMVFPGQFLEYQVKIDVRIPDNRTYDIANFQLEDSYDQNFNPNKESLEILDARSGNVISRKNYVVNWNEAAHTFVVTFAPDWIQKSLLSDNPGWLVLRFDGKVSDSVVGGTVIENQAFEIINKTRTPTPKPTVKVPNPTPDKEDLSTDLVDINGKTVVKGDKIVYRLTLDANPSRDQLAYDVHKLGMVDDYDEEFLSLTEADIQVLDQASGTDVTDKFNIQVLDGKFYVFAKTVDSTNTNGEFISGNPQPSDLSVYNSATLNPVLDPIIDQSMMGKKYWVVATTTVSKEVNDYTIENTAWQNLENWVLQTRTVYNPLKKINPSKDVVIEVGGESQDTKELKLYDVFDYQLSSSILPVNRAYASSQWSIVDDYNEAKDRYTGQWLVIASRDLYKGTELIAKAGDTLAESTSDCTPSKKGVDSKGNPVEVPEKCVNAPVLQGGFTVSNVDGILTVAATQEYLDVINSRLDIESGWTAYVQMERIGTGQVDNTLTEHHNGEPRDSSTVTTNTPEAPAIDLEKYDMESGLLLGDRDSMDQALQGKIDERGSVIEPISIGFQITNTGDVPLKGIKLSDKVSVGGGEVKNITCPDMNDSESLAKKLESLGSDKLVPIINHLQQSGIEVPEPTEETPITWEEMTPKVEEGSATSYIYGKIADGLLADGEFVLLPGEKTLCTGSLEGVKAGDHTNTATVTGTSIYSGAEVTDSDDWNAQFTEPLLPELPKTGATVLGMSGAALLLLGIGLGIVKASRRKETV